MHNQTTPNFAVIMGGPTVRIVSLKKSDVTIECEPHEHVLINPDMSAVKGHAPHHWAAVDGRLAPRSTKQNGEGGRSPNPRRMKINTKALLLGSLLFLGALALGFFLRGLIK